MRILLTGCNGQVGWELQRSLSPLGSLYAYGRDRANLADTASLRSIVSAVRPQVVVNAAAFTAVDAAETERDMAFRVNAEAAGELARLARSQGALLVHYSTDYVFDGSQSRPYVETDPVGPLNEYGRSKLEGEQRIEAAGGDWLTLRTTWVYATRGHNFLRTILRLSRECETLRIVADQMGAPTSARMIADLTAHVIARAQRERAEGGSESGVYHMTADGQTTWHEFASAIVEAARNANPAAIKTRNVAPISSDEYPTPARRPRNSVLSNARFDERFGLARLHWRDALAFALRDLDQR